MGLFTYLDKADVFRESKPFAGLNAVKFRAKSILKNRNANELLAVAEKLNAKIAAFKEDEVDRATDEYASYLLRRGGWELAYLETAEYGEPTHSEVYDLLKNWHFGSEKPGVPTEDDINDLDALRDMLDRDEFYCIDEPAVFSPSELYALLALITIEEAARLTYLEQKRGEHGSWIYPGEYPWEKRDIVRAGSLIIEAMEMVCWAERDVANETLAKAREDEKATIAARARENERDASSKKALDAKHGPARAAKKWVQDEWAKYRSEYGENKSAFARSYVTLVAHKFNNSKGEPLIVTERQMKETWLSDALPTRKA